MDTSFNIFDISDFTEFSHRSHPLPFTVNNDVILRPDGEVYARYYEGIGYVTVAEKHENHWQIQRIVTWETDVISEEMGRGNILLLSLSLTMEGGSLDLKEPSDENFSAFVEHAKANGEFYLFKFPDGSLGVRVDTVLNTVKVYGDKDYQYITVIALNLDEFENHFNMTLTDLAAHNRFKGSRQTFYF